MKKEENSPHKFESLSDLHRVLGLPKPMHPMVSLVNNTDNEIGINNLPNPCILNFYKISYRPNLRGQSKYGQHYYDFGEGGLVFVSPNQVGGGGTTNEDNSGYTLLIHPIFLLNTSLAKKIKQYGFFSYGTNEALHMSETEKTTIVSILKIIEAELKLPIDNISQDIVISQIELLLNYSNRFYKRQFITRKAVHSNLLQKLEEILEDYFKDKKTVEQGLPTVHYLSEQVNLSPSYLSDMLRSLTGQNAQQHIHDKLIEKAKELLSTTDLTVAEVAYQLGFEHQQSFNKLFKTKANLSPVAFRQSFN